VGGVKRAKNIGALCLMASPVFFCGGIACDGSSGALFAQILGVGLFLIGLVLFVVGRLGGQ
jgi:hypothetical protein